MFIVVLVAVLVGLDQISKILVDKNMIEGATIPVIQDFFHITYVKNRGVAFGMFQGKISIISVVAVIAVIGIMYYMIKGIKPEEFLSKYAYAFILGGALGNIIDRIYRGFVVDFVDFRGIWQYVFNVADIWINVGVGLLIIEYIILKKKKKA